MADKFRKLNADEIEVRVKTVGEKGATALLYKTARTDMQLLDETVGAESWSCDYKEIKGNLFCGITIDGVTKWDCGIESREDNEGNEKKGEASDAFKRAGFRWGIGRELYTSPFIWLKTQTEKNNKGSWIVSNFATFSVKSIGYDGNRISSLSIVDDKSGAVVYTFPRGGKQAHDEPKYEPQDTKEAIEKMQKVLFALGGGDVERVVTFAERIFPDCLFEQMSLEQLTAVKLKLVNALKVAQEDV